MPIRECFSLRNIGIVSVSLSCFNKKIMTRDLVSQNSKKSD